MIIWKTYVIPMHEVKLLGILNLSPILYSDSFQQVIKVKLKYVVSHLMNTLSEKVEVN